MCWAFIRKLFVVTLAATVGAVSTTGNESAAEDGLVFKISLNSQVNNELGLDVCRQFNIVVINNTEREIVLPYPNSMEAYDLFSFRFTNLDAGTIYLTERRQLDEQETIEMNRLYGTANRDVKLQPGSQTYYRIYFSELPIQLRQNNSIQSMRAFKSSWENIPEPDEDARFRVKAIPDFNRIKALNDQLRSIKVDCTPVESRIAASNLKKPHYCLWYGKPELALRLMKADREWIIKTENVGAGRKWTPLHCAACFGQYEVVKWLLENGANINALDQYRHTPLHLASDPKIVSEILKYKPLLTIISTQQKQTPLQSAVERGNQSSSEKEKTQLSEVARLLVEAGAVYDLRSAVFLNDLDHIKSIAAETPEKLHEGKLNNPLRVAASLGRNEICKYLLNEHQVDIDQFAEGSGCPIVFDALEFPGTLQLLIDHGANIETGFYRSNRRVGNKYLRSLGSKATVLHYAAEMNSMESFELLLNAGMDAFTDGNGGEIPAGNSAFEIAVRNGHIAKVKRVLELDQYKTLDPDVRRDTLSRSLIDATGKSSLIKDDQRLELVELLLNEGADPSFKDQLNYTPLSAAGLWFQRSPKDQRSLASECIRLLEQYGGKMDLCTALTIGEQVRIDRMIKNNKDCLEVTRYDGYAPLHLAVMYDRPGVIDQLIDAGVEVDIKNTHNNSSYQNQTPLYLAINQNKPEIAKKLLEVGADPNIPAYYQRTPLHIAVTSRRVELIELLVKHGANPNLKDKKNKSPLDYCRQVSWNEQAKAIEILEQKADQSK